jgi:arsenate reductase
MAEGWARALHGERIDAHSAGIEAQGVNPRAVQVMAEAGVDIRGQRSRTIDRLERTDFDWVITVCGAADERCPVFPGAPRRLHRGFDDPPRLARDARSEDEALAPYRRVRDEIRSFIETLPRQLETTR